MEIEVISAFGTLAVAVFVAVSIWIEGRRIREREMDAFFSEYTRTSKLS